MATADGTELETVQLTIVQGWDPWPYDPVGSIVISSQVLMEIGPDSETTGTIGLSGGAIFTLELEAKGTDEQLYAIGNPHGDLITPALRNTESATKGRFSAAESN